MNEIMEKTYELIDVLESCDVVGDLVFYRDRIIGNRELQNLIHDGNSNRDSYMKMDIKRRLYQNKDYQGYMDKYQELMYVVMDINSRYQKIIGKGSCYM